MTVLFRSGRDNKESKEPNTHFYRIRVDGGEAATAFCIPLNVSQIEGLGDGNWLLTAEYDPLWDDLPRDKEQKDAFIEQREKEKDWTSLEEIPFWFNGKGYTNKKRNRLYRFSESDGALTPLTDENSDIGLFSLSADKSKAAFILNEKIDKMQLDEQIGVLTIETGEIRVYDPLDGGSVWFVEFAGQDLFFAATDRKQHGLNEDPHIYVLYSDGTSQRITPDTFEMSLGSSVNSDLRRGGGYSVRPDGEDLYFIATVKHQSHIYKINKEGVVAPVVVRDGSVDSFDVKDGNVYYVGMHRLQPQALYDGNKILTSPEDILPTPKKPTAFTFASRGQEHTAFVIAPTRRNDETSFPSILLIHGGPKTVYGDVLHHEMQLLAQVGYYVFYANPFGSDGYGKDFMDLRGGYGVKDYADLMALTDAFLAKYPDADPNRVGVMGGSYGGWMTNWIIGHTDRFAAACSQRSISNWISFFGNSDIGYYFTPDQAGADPWTDSDKLWNNSPLKYADRVKTPTLFIHSDQDYRCWLPEGLQMYTALKYHNVPARMVVFHGENHELSRGGKPRSRVKRLEEILTWFSIHLKG